MLSSIDLWLARKVMHPAIIAMCQRTGMTQYAVARYAWMVAMWTLVMRLSFEGLGSWLFAILVVAMTLFETIRAATRPDVPTRSNDQLRKLILLFAAFDVVELGMRSYVRGFHGFSWGQAWDLCALTGEYAKTIHTIPPRVIQSRKRKQQTA